MESIISKIDSHVADHGHISFRGHPWCRFLEDSGYIDHTQMLLIWPTYLNFENVICEGLLVTASVGFSQTHELLDLRWRIVSAKFEGSILGRRREECDATSFRMSEKDWSSRETRSSFRHARNFSAYSDCAFSAGIIETVIFGAGFLLNVICVAKRVHNPLSRG